MEKKLEDEKKNIKWHLEEMSNEDQIQGIIGLRKVTFTDEDIDKENLDFWNWEFKNNYAGESKIYLAIDDEKVVGHYAICPSNIVIDAEIKTGSIVVDVMTHPDFRFQGMFTKIGQFSLDSAGKDGIDFSYGFPIRKSVMPGHLKVGWKIAFPLPVYVYPISFYKLIRRFIKLRVLSAIVAIFPAAVYEVYSIFRNIGIAKYKVVHSKHFENTIALQDFIKETSNQHKVMQQRDWQFLNWRYNCNTYRTYEIITLYDNDKMMGYAVLRRSNIFELDCITIIDMQARGCGKNIIKQLLNEIKKYAKSIGVALVGCMTNNNIYKTQMLKDFYLKSPYIFKFIVHTNRPIDYEDVILKNENWLLMWADTDDL